MRYLVVLTATEAKAFIAKTLTKRDSGIERALEDGTIVIHPSTSTFFVYEEIMGQKPEGFFFAGCIAPKGMCISREFEEVAAKRKRRFDQKDVTYSWVFKKGQLCKGLSLGECLEAMGPGDYYIKGVNVIDCSGNAGVLTANPDGGTITRVMGHAKKRKFDLLLIATMNKLINVPIEEASKATGREKLDGAMGIPTGLFKVTGILMTEIEAFQLHGVKAIPIASGGLREAEGAGAFVLDGDQETVTDCLRVIEQCKGAQLPDLGFPECEQCRYGNCPHSTVNTPPILSRD